LSAYNGDLRAFQVDYEEAVEVQVLAARAYHARQTRLATHAGELADACGVKNRLIMRFNPKDFRVSRICR
jgi:hypothetical protein